MHMAVHSFSNGDVFQPCNDKYICTYISMTSYATYMYNTHTRKFVLKNFKTFSTFFSLT